MTTFYKNKSMMVINGKKLEFNKLWTMVVSLKKQLRMLIKN